MHRSLQINVIATGARRCGQLIQMHARVYRKRPVSKDDLCMERIQSCVWFIQAGRPADDKADHKRVPVSAASAGGREAPASEDGFAAGVAGVG